MGLPPVENNVASCLANKTLRSALHMGPTPTRVFVKDGIMYPIVGKSASKCGIGSVSVSYDHSTCPVSVPTLICWEIVLGRTC